MSAALHELSAPELIEAFRRKAVSPVEVARSVLGHVERWEGHLQALYLLRPDKVLEQARASEARWLRGEPLGPLDGVPVTLNPYGAPELYEIADRFTALAAELGHPPATHALATFSSLPASSGHP